MTWLLLAEVDPISGTAGWAGAGLLGAVLSWLLLRHLPAKDAQLEKLIKDKDDRIDALVKEHRETVREVIQHHTDNAVRARDDFRTILNSVIQHCEKEVTGMATVMREEFGALDTSIANLAKALNDANRRATS